MVNVLSAGADVNAKDSDGDRPLHEVMASHTGRVQGGDLVSFNGWMDGRTNFYIVHENVHAKPCVFTAPDIHSAYIIILFSEAKLPKDIHACR